MRRDLHGSSSRAEPSRLLRVILKFQKSRAGPGPQPISDSRGSRTFSRPSQSQSAGEREVSQPVSRSSSLRLGPGERRLPGPAVRPNRRSLELAPWEEAAAESWELQGGATEDRMLQFIKDKRLWSAFAVIIALIIVVTVLAAKKTAPCSPCPPHIAAGCGAWVGYQGKCYYFSETDGNWSTSQSFCSSRSASLALIDSLQELNFMRNFKGIPYYWIGLQREQNQGERWKWINGTKFNNPFPVRGEGQCAFLNDQGVSSSRCYLKRHFICNRPDECARRQFSTAGGDTMSEIT